MASKITNKMAHKINAPVREKKKKTKKWERIQNQHKINKRTIQQREMNTLLNNQIK